jgi:hypothetical protein
MEALTCAPYGETQVASGGSKQHPHHAQRVVSVRPTHLELPEAADKDRVHVEIGGHDGKRDDQDPKALRR